MGQGRGNPTRGGGEDHQTGMGTLFMLFAYYQRLMKKKMENKD